MRNLIIFDFDGVLADTFDTFYPLVNDGFKEIGLSVTKKKYQDLFADNVHKGFETLINNPIKLEKFLRFRQFNYDRYYYDKKLKAKLFPGAAKFIKKISKKYILAIASSGKKKNINHLLEEINIKKYFGLILADSKHSKEDMIKRILSKFKADPEQTKFITDTSGDIKVARIFKLKTIAVTWGFHNKKMLSLAKPDHIASDFKKLKSILKNN